jgi:hypothetical protein
VGNYPGRGLTMTPYSAAAATTTNPSDVRRKLLQCLTDYGVLLSKLAAKQLTVFHLQCCKRHKHPRLRSRRKAIRFNSQRLVTPGPQTVAEVLY